MPKLDYKFRRTFKGKNALKSKVYTDVGEYYGAVYQDLIDYDVIDTDKVKSDEDLKKFLNKNINTSSDNLFNRLRKTAEHQEVINRNLKDEGKYRLKNGKVVSVNKAKVKGIETLVYKDTIIIAKGKRTTYRDARTGRFVAIK